MTDIRELHTSFVSPNFTLITLIHKFVYRNKIGAPSTFSKSKQNLIREIPYTITKFFFYGPNFLLLKMWMVHRLYFYIQYLYSFTNNKIRE